jgi:hypothetical protein
MLKVEDIYFLERSPIARQLLYRSARIDADRADQVFLFLREAYLRHFPVTLTVEVQGVSSTMNLSFDREGPGWHLYNYLAPWVAAMRMKDVDIVEQMAKIWPDLPGWYQDEVEKTAPPIAPQTP